MHWEIIRHLSQRGLRALSAALNNRLCLILRIDSNHLWPEFGIDLFNGGL